MDPLLLSALFSFAPGLLGGLFGDPNKKLRKKVGKLTSPQNIANLTNQFYQSALASPAYSQAQGTIASGANRAAGDVASSLAARGIGTSGIGAILSSLGPSLVGSQQAGLRTGAYQGAQGQAQNAIQQQLQTLLGTQGPSPSQQLFAGGFEAFAPILQQYLMGLGRGGSAFAPQSAAFRPYQSPPRPAY